jgi:hypothetical protein
MSLDAGVISFLTKLFAPLFVFLSLRHPILSVLLSVAVSLWFKIKEIE